MRTVVVFFTTLCFWFILASDVEARQRTTRRGSAPQGTTTVPQQQGATGHRTVQPVPQPLTSAEAFEFLNALNEKEKLAPRSFILPITKYNALKVENCFGVRLPNGLRIAGESSGDSYGVRVSRSFGKEKAQIGFFNSEFGFRLSSKEFPPGPYIVLASSGAIELHGDDPSATHYDSYRREEIPQTKIEEFPLSATLPETLFAEKTEHVPRFSIAVEGGSIVLQVHENKLRLEPSAKR